MSENSSPKLSDINLARARAADGYFLWQAAFLCCALDPGYSSPGGTIADLSAWPAVANVAERILREVPNTKAPVKDPYPISTEGYSRLIAAIRKEPERTAHAADDGGEEERSETSEAARRFVIPVIVELATNQKRELFLWYSRRDLQEWVRRPDNRDVLVAARFLSESDDEPRETTRTADLSDNERAKLLSIIGALARVAATLTSKYRHGTTAEPNAKAITDKAIELLEDKHGVPPYGLGATTIRDTISAGLKVLHNRMKRD